MRPAAARLVAGLSTALVLACGAPPAPPQTAQAAARAFVDWARSTDPALENAASFVDEALLARHGGSLVEAASALAGSGAPEVRSVFPVEVGDHAVVDFESPAAGGARLRFSVTAARAPDGTYRVIAFAGPGWGWPEAAPPAGEGLTTSPPPRR